VVITIHPAREASVQAAIRLIADLEDVKTVDSLLRIEDEA
jgi:hypothetical protein